MIINENQDTMNILKTSTKGLINWKPDAEGERLQMSKLYTDLLGIQDAVDNNQFIIMGRKGSGKSAYAVHLQVLASDKDNMMFCESIDNQSIELEKLINEVDDGTTQYTALLEWLILTAFVKLILNTQDGKQNRNYKELESFYKNTTGHVHFTKDTISETVKTREFNIKPLQNISMKAGYTTTNKSYKVSFLKMVDSLRLAVCETLAMEVYRKYKYYILIDDLDVDFSLNDEQAKKRLLALIRIVCKYNTTYLTKTTSKVLVFVRNDIANKLSNIGGDSQKLLDSYSYTLNWYRGIEDGDDYLYKMINHRLESVFIDRNVSIKKNQQPWDVFAVDSYVQFKKLLDYTFYLPRDVINIINRSGSKNWTLPLKAYQFETLIYEYLASKYEEICNELNVSFTPKEIEDFRRILYKIAKEIKMNGALSYKQVMDFLEEISFTRSHFQVLIEHDVLIPVDMDNEKNIHYSYREKKTLGTEEDYLYSMSKILYEYFNNNK